MDKKKQKVSILWAKASMTIELVLLFTIFIPIFLAVCSYVFYAYDYIVTTMYCNYVCEQQIAWIMEDIDEETKGIDWEKREEKSLGWQLYYNYTEKEQIVETKVTEFLNEAFLSSKCEEIHVSLSYGKVQIDYKVLFNHFGLNGLRFIAADNISIEGSSKKEQLEAEELIRMARGIIFRK